MDVDPEDCCRVCGLDQGEPPWGDDGASPTFAICSCCGVEFGDGDNNAVALKRWREKWLAAGAQWWWPQAMPPDWDLDAQMRQIPARFR